MKDTLRDLARLTEEHKRGVLYRSAKRFFEQEHGVDFSTHVVFMPHAWAEKAGLPWLEEKNIEDGLASSKNLPEEKLLIIDREALLSYAFTDATA